MTTIVTVECESCEGKTVVKIPNGYDDDYKVQACPLCGVAWEGHDDMGEE